jgi:hypothetical protein
MDKRKRRDGQKAWRDLISTKIRTIGGRKGATENGNLEFDLLAKYVGRV